MGDIYKPKDGECVRVVYEGVANNIGSIGFDIGEAPFLFEDTGLVSIEKLEPPVEYFKPGDVVRYKGLNGEYVFVLGKRGYFDLHNAVWNEGESNLDQFTSERYEKVSLG